MVVDNKYTFDSAAHSEVFIVVLQTLKTSRYRRVLFRLSLLGAVIHEIRVPIKCGAYTDLNVKFDRG